MKEIASDLRKAVIDAITPLVISGVTIPVRDSFLNPNVSPASYLGGKAYVLITDQNDAETIGNRCSGRQTVGLTIDIITKFPVGSSGRLASENFSSVIRPLITKTNLVLPSDWLIIDMKSFGQSIIEQGSSEIAYRKLLRYSFDIWEVA